MVAWPLLSTAPQRVIVANRDRSPGLSRKMLSPADRCPDLPVVLCTVYRDVINREAARQLGIREYLAKPIDSGRMLEVISSLLPHHHPARG